MDVASLIVAQARIHDFSWAILHHTKGRYIQIYKANTHTFHTHTGYDSSHRQQQSLKTRGVMHGGTASRWLRGAASRRRFDTVTERHDCVAVERRDGTAAVWNGCTTAERHDGLAILQHGGVAPRLRAVRRHGGTTARRHE